MNNFKDLWNNPSTRKIIISIGGFILVLIGSLFFQKNKMENEMALKVEFIEQKNLLRDELDDLIEGHNDLLNEYGDLNHQLHKKDSIIQHQISEIRDLIRTKNNLSEARKKIATLKDITKRYLANIDSLILINEQLTLEKDSVINLNRVINWKNYKLNKKNQQLVEKVSRGSVIEVFDVEVEAIRYRNTGREVITRYAKKAQKIRVCFRLGANLISDNEEKTIYMQLISSNRDIISDSESFSINISDSLVKYTVSSLFEYKNIEMDHCFEWERIRKLERGIYLVNLILEGRIAAQKELHLR